MDTETVVESVETLIRERGHVSFVEIERHLQVQGIPVRGTLQVMLPAPYEQIVLWGDMSQEFLDVTLTLMRRKQVAAAPASPLCYMIDGGGLTLPVAKSARKYVTEHWLPVTFSARV